MSGDSLRLGLRAGIAKVIADQERLNEINVFPVPDGDTGTNLAMTLRHVLYRMFQRPDDHAGNTLTTIADAALDGARGNSGAILAQFFQGLSEACEALPRLSVQDFTRGVSDGAVSAREALSEPKEGTLLTVLSDFAEELRGQTARGDCADFQSLLNQGLLRAKASLANTPRLLESLRKAGVVDAGGQGFVDLLSGIVDFMRDGTVVADVEIAESTLDEQVDLALAQEEVAYRYCTECIVSGKSVERRKLKEELTAIGDSVVVAGTERKIRVHIHVDDPQQAFTIAARYGNVSAQKADDMKRQQHAVHQPSRPLAVITDSAADLPDEQMERLDIHVLPLRVHFGERSYLDGVTLTCEKFYQELRTNPHHPKTSQPPPADFRRQYEFLASHYRDVLSIHVTARHSGTFQAAESAATRVKARGQITVVDSRSASLGQGLLVLYAAECAKLGFTAAQSLPLLNEMIPRTRTFGLLEDLSYAVRGGRVPGSVKTIAETLALTPILEALPSGRIRARVKAFWRRRPLEKFAGHVSKHIVEDRNYRLAVGHAQSEARARKLLELITARIPRLESSFVTEIGTALGTHGGPGTLVVAVQDYIAPERLLAAIGRA